MLWLIISCTRTTRVQSYWRKMGAMCWKFRDLLMGVVPTVNTNKLPAQR
jgi:hypothetical protein